VFGHEILHKMGKYSMYMVIRNEVKVMLFRLSAPRIFDQDCSLKFRSVSLHQCMNLSLYSTDEGRKLDLHGSKVSPKARPKGC
jgi:hypothetical protein